MWGMGTKDNVQKAGNSNEGELVVCRTKIQVQWY